MDAHIEALLSMENKHGKGTFRWPDGKYYDGDWANDKKHGVGVLKDKDGKERKGKNLKQFLVGYQIFKYYFVAITSTCITFLLVLHFYKEIFKHLNA